MENMCLDFGIVKYQKQYWNFFSFLTLDSVLESPDSEYATNG